MASWLDKKSTLDRLRERLSVEFLFIAALRLCARSADLLQEMTTRQRSLDFVLLSSVKVWPCSSMPDRMRRLGGGGLTMSGGDFGVKQGSNGKGKCDKPSRIKATTHNQQITQHHTAQHHTSPHHTTPHHTKQNKRNGMEARLRLGRSSS